MDYPTTREVGGSMRKGLLGVSRLELPQWASPAHGGASGDKLKLSAVRCGMCTQVAALLLTAYLLTMDMVLMLRLQTLNGDEQEIEARNSSGVVVSSAPSAPSIHWRDLLIPDTAIKGLFMDPMNQHIFMPLAKLTELGLDLHTTAPWLTPDRISVSHVLVAAVGMRFLACRSSLGARQLGVLLFAVRFFLDALDGEVARAVYKMKLSDPGIGSHGHLVDGVCDLAGTVFQLLGTLVLLHAHKECAGLAHACVLTAQWAVLIAASSLGWNSAISRFHDVLEGPGAAPDPVARLLVMRSFWLWVVAWLWRIVNPHALTAMLLGAVFVDKQWEWATWALKRFAVVLFILVLLTEIEFRIASITLSV